MGDQGRTGTTTPWACRPQGAVGGWAAPCALGWGAAGAWWWPGGWLWLLATHLLFYVLWSQAYTVRRKTWVGLAFGLGLHAHGHGWLFDALWVRAQASWLWALLGTTLVVVYLALYHAAAAALAGVWCRRMSRAPWVHAGVFALCLTGAEYLRSLPWNGMTGLSVGYALLDTPVVGWLPVLGVYGASVGGWWCAAALGAWWNMPRSRAMAAGALASVGAVWGGGAWLSLHAWVDPYPGAPPWTYHLLGSHQAPARAPSHTATPTSPAAWVDRLVSVNAHLVLAPESVVPLPFAQWPTAWATRLQGHSSHTRSHLFVGTLADAPGGGLNNAVLQFVPQGPVGRHNKRTLTPVGEYTPAAWSWYTNRLHIPYRDLQTGGAQPPQWVGGVAHGGNMPHRAVPVGLLVCQEDMTSAWAVSGAPMAGVWLNPSNLAWFDDHRARQLRLQAARARAAETGRPLLRAEAAGQAAHIDHRGRVVAQAPPGSDLQGVVQPQQGVTPFVRWAGWLQGVVKN